MKKLILLFLLAANVNSFAQDNAAFVGKWQVVFLKDNNTYIDIEKDSFSLKGQMQGDTQEKDTDANAAVNDEVKSFLKETINGMKYTFNKVILFCSPIIYKMIVMIIIYCKSKYKT